MKAKILSAFALGVLALSASAQNYKVVVTGTDGTKTSYETSSLKAIKFEEAPDYLETNYLVGAEYSSKDELGNYYITFGTAEPNNLGEPAGIGDIQLALEFTADRSADAFDAILPGGYYVAGSGANKGEFNLQRSGIWIRLAEGSDGVTISPLVGGAVDVRQNGTKYDIKAEVTLLTGEFVAVEYTGDILFTAGLTENLEFTEDQNITFTGTQERYYGNWFYPFCDDATMAFYTGTFDEYGSQVEGYWLAVDTFMPKNIDPSNPNYLPDGVYTVEPREAVSSYTNLPFTFGQGRTIDFWGQIYPAGTYLTYKSKNGQVTRAMIKSGTMTVSHNATLIEIDFVAENGIKIKGMYQGQVTVLDKSDPEKTPDLTGSLSSNIELNFLPETVAFSYPMKDYIKAGVNQFIIMVTEPAMQKGDYISLELMSDKEVLPDGTYTINNEIAPFCGLKGYLDYGGEMLFSWYGDLESITPEGYHEFASPLVGGTVTITTVGEGKRKLVFDCVDPKGYKITGTYEGAFLDVPEGGLQAPAKGVKGKKIAAPAEKAPELPGLSK